MLKRFAVALTACLFSYVATGQNVNDSLFGQLDIEIEKRTQYEAQRNLQIQSWKNALPRASTTEKYRLCNNIYEAYKSFIYDSAFHYGRTLQRLAHTLSDPVKIADAKIKVGFVLISSGMFNEALDTMQSVRTRTLPDTIKTEYYYMMARTCFDLADFNGDDYYRRIYTQRAQDYIDSALSILPSGSARYHLMRGLSSLHARNMGPAQEAYEKLVREFKLRESEFAIVASTLSFIYRYSGKIDLAKEMLIRAAIADIRSCTKETTATLNLAEVLYNEGDFSDAYKYVKVAMEDADFYGARQRKTQVGAIFPMIEGRQLSDVESKRRTLVIYSLLITLFTLAVVGFLIVIYRQNKKLNLARKAVSDANHTLTETNHQLEDANRIKEEYIWYYFNTTAEYINRLDALKKTLDLKLMTRKLEDLRFTVDSINIKRERDELYHNFDKVFLKLFPDFVNVFNSLFKEEDRVVPKEGQLLNTELRIFALIRMGIHDHERIAKILDYSVTTIYTYKTRIRSKSILPNDEFDKRIMRIRAI